MNIITENQLRDNFCKYLESVGLHEYSKEVNFCSNSSFIDLVYVDEKRRFICVELKLKDWKKVIEQANKIKNKIELVYIALPIPKKNEIKKKIENIIEKEKLGLYWYNKKNDTWLKHFMPKERCLFSKDSIEYFNKNLKQSFYSNKHFTFMSKCINY